MQEENFCCLFLSLTKTWKVEYSGENAVLGRWFLYMFGVLEGTEVTKSLQFASKKETPPPLLGKKMCGFC